MANCRNFRILKEIWVEEDDGDVRFKSGSGNMAVLCMRNASRNNYRNSLVIVVKVKVNVDLFSASS